MTQSQKGHPKGLYVLFGTEMWERFSYYGNRALLTLFLTKALFFDKQMASALYGNYTSLVYLTPLIGGYVADRYWGNRRSIMVGGILMAIGQLLMFFSGHYYTNPSLFTPFLYAGLGLLILGNGFFKPNISTMVGQLYEPQDSRKDSAYTIFYMGINLGAFIAPLACGLVGDTGSSADFKWGFLVAGVGMVLGLIMFHFLKDKYIVTPEGVAIGGKPEKAVKSTDGTVKPDAPLTSIEIQRIAVIIILAFFVVFFWAAFEQAGASLNFFAEEQTNRELFGFTVPASWFQSVNAFFVISCAPLFAMLWTYLGKKGIEPSSPLKMAIGLLLLSLGYLYIAFGVKDVAATTKVSMMWLVGMYAMHTFGELCLSPIGLSMVNKLAPAKFASLLMAVWFLANAAANKFAGVLSGYYPEPGKSTEFLGFAINNLNDFFMLLMFMSLGAAGVLFLIYKGIIKMMHGVH
ncbi:peptide MFS transporter [Solitalea koreensis]|uniref:Proton-dependent oligopeptide transporter, POT family n=1 Tax=Solitalea koreensis TaxID=543615 RepID=A0A521DA01_9SPHI|nr:peptide MFS transporter [Solitalea koreensis]SMO68539.1 proton-dependent oligopeptide transporter, POT family [Solitalea koreensis]